MKHFLFYSKKDIKSGINKNLKSNINVQNQNLITKICRNFLKCLNFQKCQESNTTKFGKFKKIKEIKAKLIENINKNKDETLKRKGFLRSPSFSFHIFKIYFLFILNEDICRCLVQIWSHLILEAFRKFLRILVIFFYCKN